LDHDNSFVFHSLLEFKQHGFNEVELLIHLVESIRSLVLAVVRIVPNLLKHFLD